MADKEETEKTIAEDLVVTKYKMAGEIVNRKDMPSRTRAELRANGARASRAPFRSVAAIWRVRRANAGPRPCADPPDPTTCVLLLRRSLARHVCCR